MQKQLDHHSSDYKPANKSISATNKCALQRNWFLGQWTVAIFTYVHVADIIIRHNYVLLFDWK